MVAVLWAQRARDEPTWRGSSGVWRPQEGRAASSTQPHLVKTTAGLWQLLGGKLDFPVPYIVPLREGSTKERIQGEREHLKGRGWGGRGWCWLSGREKGHGRLTREEGRSREMNR